MNGKELLLAETVIWYEVLSKKQSLEIFQLYKDKIDKIPAGDVVGVYNTLMPTYLLSEGNKAMKLRKNRKVLKVPHFQIGSREFKYSRILLYYPLAPKTVIDQERLGKISI